MRTLGIDIGTTTISVIMLDSSSGELLGKKTIAHHGFTEGQHPSNRVQDPEKLYQLTENAVLELSDSCGRPDCIGMTGQMHGMLYADEKGRAVSPLYTWQDGCGSEKMKSGITYAEFLRRNVGTAATGYGLTTHFYLDDNGLIPENAVSMTTISDYITMRLCGKAEPVLADDMAASWGCFDMREGRFLIEKLEDCGIRTELLPEVSREHAIVGETVLEELKSVPVIASLGDNQASVIGSVQDLCTTVLVNIGTGSQVSVGVQGLYKTEGSIEVRPCIGDTRLLVGAGLCGGRAYAMLKDFFRQVLAMGGEEKQDGLYGAMEKEARAFLDQHGRAEAWKIRTTFAGTRSNPLERGSIANIGSGNFTPGAMTAGMLAGIVTELYDMYKEMVKMTGVNAVSMVGSGNGIRRNALLKEIAEEIFGMKMLIPKCEEEAAYGVALHALVSAGFADSLESVQKLIRYS